MNDEINNLYQKHGPQLQKYFLRNCNNPSVAQDLLQDVFYQVMRADLSKVKNSQSWLFGIAHNLLCKHYTQKQKDVEISSYLPSRSTAPRETKDDLLGELPRTQREILELRLIDELSYEQISEVLSIPIGTVRSRLHNAVKALRKNYKTRKY